jgi:mono/diheme cytochrome c family protein
LRSFARLICSCKLRGGYQRLECYRISQDYSDWSTLTKQFRQIQFIAAIALLLFFTSCSSSSKGPGLDSIPANGDRTRGEAIFIQGKNGSPSCNTCHTLTETKLIGPGLAELAKLGGSRVQGESAREYIFHSVVEPIRYLVSGYTNLMYPDYGKQLSPQDIADVVAYVLGAIGK